MRIWFVALAFLFAGYTAAGQQVRVESPNHRVIAGLYCVQGGDKGEWYLELSGMIPKISLGLIRSDQAFWKDLHFIKAGKPLLIEEAYTVVHGKRSHCRNSASEVVVLFENGQRSKMELVIRVYNDGLAFRYRFPGSGDSLVVKEEMTAYTIPTGTARWLEKWNTANEGLYKAMKDDSVRQDWCYPALFNIPGTDKWFLLHEADLDRNYCGSKLSNVVDGATYKITFPDQRDGRGLGSSTPTIRLPWQSPWRVVIAGGLNDIVESTLIEDVSRPSVLPNTDWVRPGLVSWNYWSHNHGTKDYKVLCDFTDLAARMGWPYTLFDWEWDAMGNGGTLEDAAKYALSKGVRPLIWYNSGGPHTYVMATPRDRMLTHENRVEEFRKLNQLGFAGVKVDFFESEKQDMIRYYLDILEDAAQAKMMVYFHGCIVPRGWSRTYPNLMTCEAVRGAEWYNNGPDFTLAAPEHNCTLPFTRNVVGPMDYTPVTFTNSQFPHVTSYGHELALSVVFESGLQHLADRPEGYDGLPDSAKHFLMAVPNAWDDTKLLDGYPGQDIVLARRKGDSWWLGGLNASLREKTKKLRFGFLRAGVRYKLTLIADGEHDKALATSCQVVDSTSEVEVRMLRRGGFAATLTPEGIPGEGTFVNPVLPGDHPDPTLLKVGDDFYHCGSSFHFTPYLPVYHSRDLVHWEVIGRVVPPQVAGFVGDRPSEGIWQGAITYFYGSYWIYFSAGGQWFCKADHPAGPWSAPERVKSEENIGYDNSIFVDDDGRPYMIMKNGPKFNRIQEIGRDGQLTGNLLNLDWINAHGQYGWAEGPVMCKRNGIYYYFMAGSVAGGQYVLKAPELTEDSTKWTRLGNFFRPSTDPENRFPGVNHMSAPVQLADGSWWTIAQSYERQPADDWSGMGRQTALYRVTWDGDRPWGEAAVSTPVTAPRLQRSGLLRTSAQSDAFDGDALSPWWHFLNRRAAANVTLTARKGWVRLTPSGSRTHLVQKETDHYYSAVTCVDLDALDTAARAGIYLTNGNESVTVRLYSGYDGGRKIVLAMDTSIRSTENPYGRKVWLKLERDGHALSGYFSGDGRTWKTLGAPVSAVRLDREQPKWNWWVGTSVGLFAEGRPADFDAFVIKDGYSDIPAIGHSDYGQLRTDVADNYVTTVSPGGGWFLLTGVEIGEGTKGVETTATATPGGKLEIWLDELGVGKPAAVIPVGGTAAADGWKTFSAKLTGVSGRHDVYVVISSGAPDAIKVKSIRFIR